MTEQEIDVSTAKAHLQSLLVDPTKIRECSFPGYPEEELGKLREQGYSVYEGKVRQCISRGDTIHLVHTDRLSAFDRAITLVPYKGLALNTINTFWFQTLAGKIPSAFLSSDGDRTLHMEKLQPIKAEVIVRGYLAGSMQRVYETGERLFCGEKLPEGLQAYAKLPEPILTPTSKAEVYQHDENRTPAELIEEGVCTESEWERIRSLALKLFAIGTEEYRKRGWILVDTKYEFGRSETGEIKLIDEVHTPDSSRLWKADSYTQRLQGGLAPEMLDKELIRRYLLSQGFSGSGPVPQVPLTQILELADVYLSVAESLQ